MNTRPPIRPAHRVLWVLAGLALVTAVVLWRTGTWEPGTPENNDDQVAVTNTDPGLVVFPVAQRSRIPEIKGTTLDGAPLKLSDFQSKVVVINIWGSWCGPCRVETPDLVRLANENANRGVQFLGIDTRDNADSARAFAKKFEMPYPSLFDEGGRVLLPLRGVVPSAVIPSTVVVDRQGRVAARVIGPVTYKTLNGVLSDELAGGTS